MEKKPFQRVGYVTNVAAVYKSESHKLHQSFPVKKGKTIVPGQPVSLENDGSISPYAGGDEEIYLGIAVTSSITPAYPELPMAPEVTVMVEGFAVVYGVSNGEVKPGYVNVVDGTTDDSGFVKYQTSTKASKFIALNAVENEGELIQIIVR